MGIGHIVYRPPLENEVWDSGNRTVPPTCRTSSMEPSSSVNGSLFLTSSFFFFFFFFFFPPVLCSSSPSLDEDRRSLWCLVSCCCEIKEGLIWD